METKVAKNPIIEQIHQEISSEESKTLKRIKYFLNEVNDDERNELAEKLKNKGFKNSISVNKFNAVNISKAQSLLQSIEHYNTLYPTKKFITEDALYEVCSKYGLIITTPDRYTGFIPVEKQREIVQFEPKEQDIEVHKFKLDINSEDKKYLKDMLDTLSNWTFNKSDRYIYDRISNVNINNYLDFINKYMDQVISFIKDEFSYDVFIEGRYASVQYSNDIPKAYYEKYDKIDYSSRYVIVASKNLIDMSGMRVNNKFELVPFIPEEEFDKLRKKEAKIREEQQRKFFLQDDPIVLFKVKYGYIVVSAWGEEAEDPLIVNHKFN